MQVHGIASPVHACPNESIVARYLAGDVNAGARASLEVHAAACVPCRELLSELAHGATLEASEACEIEGRLLLPPGACVDRYVIEGPLGAGAMGVVYAARDPDLGRRVALKIVDRAAEGSGARQLREAQALARVDHPHVVTVYDVGVHAEHVFVAMELVDGEDFASWLRTPRPTRAILDALLGAGRGLAAAHAAGLVHRDFKPANVLIGADGRARVTDFGLAKVAEDATVDGALSAPALAQDMTMRGALLGTPAYMAPEQFAGLRAGAAADQFAFAVTAWEALYGRRPFTGTTLAQLRDAVTRGELEAPAHAPVRAGIERALRRALDPEPARRWPSLVMLLDELARDPARRVRRVLVAGGAAAVLVGGGFALAHLRTQATAGPSCELAPTWTAPQHVALAATAARLGRTQLVTEVAGALDVYAGQLAAANARACGRPSDDPVTICLDRRRVELARLVDVLVGADRAAVLDRADKAIDGLADPAGCATASAETLPHDLASRMALDIARGQVAYGAALDATAQPRAAAAVFATLVPSVRALANESLLAVTLTHYAATLVLFDPEQAEAMYIEAAQHASAAHDDDQLASTWLDLAMFVGLERKKEREALSYAEAARAAIAAAGDKPILLARYFGARAAILQDADRQTEAAAAYEAALSLARAKLPPDAKLTETIEFDYAMNLEARGKLADAAAIFERALAADDAKRPHHPHAANACMNLGLIAYHRNRPEDAARYLMRAISIFETSYGADNIRVGQALMNLASVRGAQARYRDAVDLATRAAHIMERGHHPQLATVLVNRAGDLMYLRDLVHAREDLQRAIAISRASGDRSTQVNAEASLGDLAYDMGDFRAALPHYQAALELDGERNDEDDAIRAGYLLSLGHTLGLVGRHREALATLERAYKVYAQAEGHGAMRAMVMLSLAEELHALHRDPKRAHELAIEVAHMPDLPREDKRRLARLI